MGSGNSRFLGGVRGSAAWGSEFVAQIGGGELKFFPFRAHDFQVNARGWRLGGLPCTIVAAHGSNPAPTFPFTFITHGIWFEPPGKICAKDGEFSPPIPQALAHIRIRLNYLCRALAPPTHLLPPFPIHLNYPARSRRDAIFGAPTGADAQGRSTDKVPAMRPFRWRRPKSGRLFANL